jgi:ATP-dependent DNA helicase RecG
MQNFKNHQIDLLVATTVIEVGVDVPNAGLMIIENPERLGLSQLHQLRGRVGRGKNDSYCLLLYQSPLSDTARHRLGILRDTNDGFVIAEKDLELRGPGEVMGTRQTGQMQFKIADLDRDTDLLDNIPTIAESLLHHSPDAVQPLIKRWLGETVNYAEV